MFSITAPRMDDKQVEHERDNMSEDEKMVIFRDLYGKEEPETALSPDEEDDLLAKLQEELDAIKVKDGYDLAAQRCNDILQDRDFRLQFLAAETNDVKRAATRFVNYWATKKETFGDSALFAKRKITISDLSDKEKRALSQSVFYKLPSTDRHGRLILFSTRMGWVFDKPMEMRRAMWYTFQTFSEDPACRSKGVVIIAFDVGSYELANDNRKASSGTVRLLRSTPVRFVSIHHITNSKIIKMVWPVVMFLFGKNLRKRVVKHSSDRKRWLEEFAKYGFAKEDLPEVMTGSLQFDYAEWLKEREEQGL